MSRVEFMAQTNDGTKYKITWNRKTNEYDFYYRNGLIPIQGPYGKVCGQWVLVDSQECYSDVLAYAFEEISSVNAKNGS